jgi:hypothetical protein
MIGIGLHGFRCCGDFIWLAHLLGVPGIRRRGKRESPYKDRNKKLEGKRRHGGLRKKSGSLSLNELR